MYLMYLRKSRADNPNETVEEVLSKHEQILQDYVRREFGAPLPEENIYREVCSGESIEERTEIKKVLQRMEDKSVTGIVVVEPQRLSRGDLIDCGTLIQAFRYTNTQILTPTMTYNLENKMERKFFQDELLRGRDYLEYTKEILFRGRVAAAKRGCFAHNNPPYGYDRIQIGKDYTLTPNENAVYVKMVFDWYAHWHLSIGEIVKKLNEMKAPTQRDSQWGYHTVHKMLSNRHYLGKVFFATTKETIVIEGGVRRRKTVRRPQDEWVEAEGKHPAIIDQETFDLVQKIKESSAPKLKNGYKLSNPFSGLLFCKKCGRAERLRIIKRYWKIMCNRVPACHKPVPMEEVEKHVIHALEKGGLPILKDLLEKQRNGVLSKENGVINALQKKLAALAKQEEKQYDLLEKGIYSEEVFDKRNFAIKEEQAKIRLQIENAKTNAPKDVDYEEKLAQLKAAIKCLKSDNSTPKEKNDLLKLVVRRIEMENLATKKEFGKHRLSLEIFYKF